MPHTFRRPAIALIICSAISGVQAAPLSLDEAASKAVLTNPEVRAKWHEFKASGSERDITWARNLPTLDAIYGIANQHRKSPLYTPPESERKYTFQDGKVTLRQNLFEGFATINDTKRLEHATMVRFYEMLDASENAAFEAASAYIDVWRRRKLVEFAEENYVAHRLTHEKVKERAKSGVGRQVDLETATGRLALAEANLLTETANLHDVSARYQRIIGELPGSEMAPPPSILSKGLPKERAESINLGYEKSPRLKAAFENILSAKRNVEVQQSGYYPRVDAYLEGVHDSNASGFTGITTEKTAGLTVAWNLFRGNQDRSRKLKAAEEVNIAKDLREKVCREVRQNLSMSFNDHLRLTEQLQYHDQHQLSADKVREAFRDQYEIGQRTLLDVLDNENEYYTARRDYLNSSMDLLIADAKYQASAGNLLNTLALKNLDMTPPKPVTAPDEDMFTTCPAEDAGVMAINKEDLFNRALEKDRLSRAKTIPVPPPVPAPAIPAPPPPIPTAKEFVKQARPVVVSGANFKTLSDKLLKGADAKLAEVIDVAKRYPDIKFEVSGHCDNQNTTGINPVLSERRAAAVKAYMVKKGIAADRITTAGYSDTKPVADNNTPEGRAANRRVEIRFMLAE